MTKLGEDRIKTAAGTNKSEKKRDIQVEWDQGPSTLVVFIQNNVIQTHRNEKTGRRRKKKESIV